MHPGTGLRTGSKATRDAYDVGLRISDVTLLHVQAWYRFERNDGFAAQLNCSLKNFLRIAYVDYECREGATTRQRACADSTPDSVLNSIYQAVVEFIDGTPVCDRPSEQVTIELSQSVAIFAHHLEPDDLISHNLLLFLLRIGCRLTDARRRSKRTAVYGWLARSHSRNDPMCRRRLPSGWC